MARWSKLCESSNLELWVPEPVLWEWAEHAADDWRESTTLASSARRALVAAGIDVPVSPYSDREEVIEYIEISVREIRGALRVLPLTGEAAVEALRDQILQRAPATKKEGVKTGASDSAWLRMVRSQIDESAEYVLIVGNDSDVNAALSAWNISAMSQVPLHQLASILFVFDEPEDTVIDSLIRFVDTSIPAGIIDAPPDERRIVIGRTPDLASELEGLDGMPTSISDADIVSIDSLLGISEIQVDRMHATISATIFLLAEVEYITWNEDRDGRAFPRTDRAGGFLVRDRLTFSWLDNKITRGLTDDDDAFVAQIGYFYWSPDDAVNELLQVLSYTPGLEIEAELNEGVIPEEVSYTSNGRLVTLEKADHGDGEWEVLISVQNGDRTSQITITCDFDVSANPTEIPDLFPAWRVSTSGTPRPAAPGVWGVSQWLIEKVWDSNLP